MTAGDLAVALADVDPAAEVLAWHPDCGWMAVTTQGALPAAAGPLPTTLPAPAVLALVPRRT